MATINDVARLAGVTHTTVSHTLSGKRPVAPATREAVLAAVRQLDYRPNSNAVSLTARRTRRVCLSIPLDAAQRSLSKGPSFDFIAEVGDRLGQRDYTLVCEISRGLDAVGVVDLVRAGHVDGVLLLGTQLTDARVEALQREGFPFVAIGRTREPANFVWVDSDTDHSATLAVRHLFELGHRKIAFVVPTMQGEPVLGSHFHALAGFKRTHREYGVPLARKQVITYEVAEGLGDRLVPLLTGTLGVTAVIAAGHDLEAVTILRAYAEHRLRVPDDISLVGLVDSPLTQMAQPAITVIDIPVKELCTRAVDLLIDLIEGFKPRQNEHILPVTLVVRSSTQRVGSPIRRPRDSPGVTQ
jgi:DNA-binding LacI/PurR family transcriptional regulator